MSDLIERLRSPTSGNALLCHKAADEIERLQSRLRDRQNALDHAIDYGHRKDAEIERLRKQKQIAVNALFEICQSDWGIGHSLARPAHKAIKAIAALENDHE